MNNEEMDIYIKSKIKDNHIPEKIDNLFNNSAKIIENKGEKQMEENLKSNQNQGQNNNNQKKPEKNKKQGALKRVLATAACLTLLLGGGNIYASTQGYDNIFFLIAEKLGISLDVFGKENILSDRDITISYRPIEIAKGTQIQINNLVIKDNQAKLKLQVKSSNVKNTLAPLKYIVKDENGSELCNYTSAHTQSNVDYREEIILNNYKEETKKLELEILKSNNTSIVKLEIDLENKKINVIGTAEELTKISEEELKQYLGAFAMLNYSGTDYNIKMTENEKKTITALLIAESKAINVDAGLYSNNNKDVRRVLDKEKVHAIVESFTDLKLNENGIMDFSNSKIFENLTFKEKLQYLYKLDTLGCSPTVMEVTNIDFIGGIYNVTFKFCYSTEENKGFAENSIEDLPIYEMSMGLILDDDNEYSKYRVSTMSEVRLAESDEGLKVHSNKEYIYMRESYDVEFDMKINESGDIFKDKIEIPYININSEDAKKANQEIYKMYEKAVKSVVKETYYSYTDISYKYSIVDNIISLCIDSTPLDIPGGGFTSERTVYNFSLTDGKRLSTKETLSKLNMTEESLIERINLELKDWYINGGEVDILGEITEKDFYESFDYNLNAIYFETDTIAEVYFFENPFLGGMSKKINIFSYTDVKNEKSYSEIIENLNINNFDKNKFDGKFLIKKVNNLTLGEDNVSYYNINGELVDKYDIKTVLATWNDISNYESNLYKGLVVNKKIPYSSQMIYRNNISSETTFYLEANKTSYSAEETIKDSFDNNNVGLFWSAKDLEKSICASEVINVSEELKQKWNNNELGMFIELLGDPSRVYRMPDTNGDNAGFSYDVEFDLIKKYYLFWEYDEYYIRMHIQSLIEDEKEKNNCISQIVVQSKNSNSSVGDYKTSITNCENSAQK